MVIDPRRDHAIQIPRPDLSQKLGTPNACGNCHREQSAQWARAKFREWYGERNEAHPRYAEAIHAGRRAAPRGEQSLIALSRDGRQPAIVRATAITLLPRYRSRAVIGVLDAALHDPEPLVRMAALDAMVQFPPELAQRLGAHLLEDPLLAIRADAGRVLAALPKSRLDASTLHRLDAAVDDYIAIQTRNADRSEAQVNLGNLLVRLDRRDEAEASYRRAIELDGTFTPAYVNLADLQRVLGRESDVEATLRGGIERVSGDASLYYGLGLALVRQRRTPEALEALARAAELAPDVARYAYVHGIALNGAGRRGDAIAVLERALLRHSTDRDILFALATISRDAGDRARAQRYASSFAGLWPSDPRADALRDWK